MCITSSRSRRISLPCDKLEKTSQPASANGLGQLLSLNDDEPVRQTPHALALYVTQGPMALFSRKKKVDAAANGTEETTLAKGKGEKRPAST
jgi:hypothetical protein